MTEDEWNVTERRGGRHIERALTAYTEGVAEQAFAEGVCGRLIPGASADLVWLDRDPRAVGR
jgi:predicted amidohydrolase YtcJ